MTGQITLVEEVDMKERRSPVRRRASGRMSKRGLRGEPEVSLMAIAAAVDALGAGSKRGQQRLLVLLLVGAQGELCRCCGPHRARARCCVAKSAGYRLKSW